MFGRLFGDRCRESHRSLAIERLHERIAMTIDVSLVGDAIAVATNAELPSIGMAPTGEYIVAWDKDLEVEGQLRMFGESNSASDLQISNNPSDARQFLSSVSMAANGRFAVSWKDLGDEQVLAQVYNATGINISNPIMIPGASLHDIAISKDMVTVVWSDNSNQVFAQTYDHLGNALISDPLSLGNGVAPSVAMSPDGSRVPRVPISATKPST